MDYRPEKEEEGKAVFSNWMDYSHQNSGGDEPETIKNALPPRSVPPMMQFQNDSGMMNSDSIQYPPLTSPHFVPSNNRKETPLPALPLLEDNTPALALESPPTKMRKGETVEEDEDALDDFVEEEIVSQPDLRYTCQMKPSRRKGTRFADHGDVPNHLCSAPYKYLMKISHPLDDGLNENDFDVYLTAYDRKHKEKGQLQGGLELEYLRSTVNEKNEQVHFYHIQFTLTSFLNQNEKYRLNVVISGEEEDDERLILQSGEFLLVARKNKKTDDLFWDKYSDNAVVSRKKKKKKRKRKTKKNISTTNRRKSSKKKKKKPSTTTRRNNTRRKNVPTTTTRRRKRRRRTKLIDDDDDEVEVQQQQMIGRKRKREECEENNNNNMMMMNMMMLNNNINNNNNSTPSPNGFVFVNSNFGNIPVPQQPQQVGVSTKPPPRKKRKLD